MPLMKWNGSFWCLVVGLWLLVGCTPNEQVTFPETSNYNIIPAPQSIDSLDGFFLVNSETKIHTIESCAIQANNFQHFLQGQTKFNI